MVLSLLAKLKNKYFQQFIKQWGREPQSAREWMSIQDNAVRELNATKGVTGVKKPWHQGWNPQVIEGGKGIESLIKSGDVKKGVAPKTTKETLKTKKDRGILLRDADEDIARIKRENKQAIKDFKEKKKDWRKDEDWDDKGPWDESKKDPFKDEDWDDFASGGIARVGYFKGQLVKGASWFIKNLRQAYDELIEGKAFTHLQEWEREGLKWEILAQMKQIERGGPIPKEMIEYMRKDKRFKDITKTRSTDPELYEVEDILLNYGKKGDVVDEQLEVLEKFTPTGKGNAEGGRIGLMYGGDPGFAFEYGGSWADWRDQHQHQMPVTDYIKTKLPKERLPFRDMQEGGLAYMLGEPTYMKYSTGGAVGHAPWLKPSGRPQPEAQGETPTPHVAGTPDPLKAPRGIPSLAPKNMDPAYMQQQMMQRAMMGRGPGMMGQGPRTMANQGGRIGFDNGGFTQDDFNQFLKEREEGHREGGKQDILRDWERYKLYKKYGKGAVQEAAEGGIIRTGFKKGGDMSRRGFMKLIAGLAALPIVGKYFKAAKLAKPAAAVTETITRGADGMPKYIYDLIQVVKAKGTKDFIEGFKRSDYSTVHSYKGVDVIEDASGSIRIKKPTEGVATDARTGKMHEGTSQEVHIEITPGEVITKDEGLKTAKKIQAPDEYFEGTVRPDMDGKMKDIEEFVEEADHLDLKRIADEVDTLIIKKTKKASGGLAGLLGE